MTESLLTLTPSFISRIIRQSRQLKSEAEVLAIYEKFADLKDTVLDEDHANDVLSDEQEHLLSENIPDTLRPFAEALFGAVSNITEETKSEQAPPVV